MSEGVAAPGHLLEGKYEIVGVVGEGAWGQVLEGVNIRIRRKVAIKILKAEYASNADMVRRFEREALASTHIESPHVVQIFDAGVLADGRPYLVMEFLTGEDLSTHIALSGRLPIVASVDLCAQVARGLAAAHSAGVFHRDMKPSNIVIAKTKSGREIAKIVDFGISKLLDVSKPSISHTQTGTVLGSPVYMSPEQARGSKETDHRSDLYSLGVVLFECLTGRTPHNADGFNELLFKIVLEATPSVRSLRPEVDEELDAIMRLLLAKTPELRVQTATELESLLVGWLSKNGAKLTDSPIESGERLLPDLTATPIDEDRPASVSRVETVLRQTPVNLQATVPVASVNTPSEPSLAQVFDGDAAEGRVASGVAQTVPAPSTSSSPLHDSSLTDPKVAQAPSRRSYVIGGVVGIGLLLGGYAVATNHRGGPSGAGSSGVSGERPPATVTPTTSVTATPDPSVLGATTAAGSPSSATVASSASSVTVASSASASAASSVVRVVVPPVVPGVVASARPKPTASARPSAEQPQPAASSASSASVGGRTIRTDL